MSRSHPPSLLTIVRRTLREEKLARAGERVLVAASGGPDSMVLLHVLAWLRDEVGYELCAHGVDHGLRPEASHELDVAAGFAARLDVPFERTVLSLAPGGNLQARARDARYEALESAAARLGATTIATAHHADDRAETLLLRLIRGSGPRGIAVLPPRFRERIRPLIRARHGDVLTHAARHHVPYALDPSNEDPRFLRVRVRREVLPLLTELNPNVVEHLCSLADMLLEEDRGRAIRENDELDGLHTHKASLPRATQLALRALTRSKEGRTAVELPGGLVATYDHDQHRMVVEASGAPGWKHRVRDGRHRNES